MKNENSSKKTSPIGLHLLTIFFVASSMIMERFGTYPNYSNHYGKFAYSELFGIVIPIAIFPSCFCKGMQREILEQRKSYYNFNYFDTKYFLCARYVLK